jgi:cell division protein FtsB
MIKELGYKISSLLEKPAKVFMLCLLLLFTGLVFDGSLWRLYQIWKNQEIIASRIQDENIKIVKIKQQLSQLKNPEYIEKQARERLEFLEKNDLLFVFSEE